MDAELKETDDLVKFAEGLDFEKCMYRVTGQRLSS